MDILAELTFDDVKQLRTIYQRHQDTLPFIYGFFNTSLKWIQQRPDKKYFTFYAPNGDYSDGTFIALMEFYCYDFFIFTLEESCDRLMRALRDTNVIDFTRSVSFYCVHEKVVQPILHALSERNIKLDHSTVTSAYSMRKEQATNLEANLPHSNDFYIGTLKPEHADVVNSVWPHRYNGSERYLRTIIELNGGHGVFRKQDGKLVAWVLKNQMGMLGVLQTLDEFKQMGFGSAITRSLSKEIAQDGHHPFGTVLVGNRASERMFDKLAFCVLYKCSYIETISTATK